MKRLSRLLLGILSCFVLLYSTAHAESDRAFLSKTIRAKLTEPSEIFNAKYGRRSITLKRLATSECEMRLALWTLMGEPVQTYEFRMPRLREIDLSRQTMITRIALQSVATSVNQRRTTSPIHGGITQSTSAWMCWIKSSTWISAFRLRHTVTLNSLPEEYRSEWTNIRTGRVLYEWHFKSVYPFDITQVLLESAPGQMGLGHSRKSTMG